MESVCWMAVLWWKEAMPDPFVPSAIILQIEKFMTA